LRHELLTAFLDIVGISDEDTWEYSEELVQIATNNGYTRLKLLRAMDILGYTEGKPKTQKTYMELAPIVRQVILKQYGRTKDEIRDMILSDHDSNTTYCGFVRFLEADLKYSSVANTATSGRKFRKIIKAVACKMMMRAEVFV
jgi:pyoverdine/dityrosine biosynthesis protein Dit1